MTDDGGSRPDAYFQTDEIIEGAAQYEASIIHMDDYPSYEIADGLFFRPVFAQNISLNFVTFPPESGFPTHTHPEEQISIVREGEMELIIAGLSRMIRPGDVIVFPPDVPHAGRTFERPCRIIDIFSPPRTGIRQVVAGADAQRSSEVDRWWKPEDDIDRPAEPR